MTSSCTKLGVKLVHGASLLYVPYILMCGGLLTRYGSLHTPWVMAYSPAMVPYIPLSDGLLTRYGSLHTPEWWLTHPLWFLQISWWWSAGTWSGSTAPARSRGLQIQPTRRSARWARESRCRSGAGSSHRNVSPSTSKPASRHNQEAVESGELGLSCKIKLYSHREQGIYTNVKLWIFA